MSQPPPVSAPSNRLSMWLAVLMCAILVALAVLRRWLLFPYWVIPIGYGIPVAVIAYMANRRLLWTTAALFMLVIAWWVGFSAAVSFSAKTTTKETAKDIVTGLLTMADFLLVAGVVDFLLKRHLAGQAEIARVNQEVDKKTDALRVAEEAASRKNRFLSAVSHDIRTPANAIGLLAELIQRSAGNAEMMAEVPELAKELQTSALGLVSLISDVLDVTRLDAGHVDLHKSEFDLNELLTDNCRQLSPLAEQKHLAFECLPHLHPIKIKADRIKLSRVLINLMGNAIKFTEKGQVHIAGMLLDDGRPQISVRDTGIGIAAEHLPRIFDEFFQLKNPDRDRQKGTGLGLSISKRLIEAMEGKLDVASVVGQGSTFTITLPASCVVG